MLSFELSAIDIILSISVIVLLILYVTKLSARNDEEKTFKQRPPVQSKLIDAPLEAPAPLIQRDYTDCPRGFGNIRKLGEENSVSERCLGCYRIMECYSESE